MVDAGNGSSRYDGHDVGEPTPRSSRHADASQPDPAAPYENPYDAAVAQEAQSQSVPPFVRARSPHITQPPVDDLATDDLIADTTSHDSSYIKPSKNPLAGMGYRRSRSKMPQLQHELHYGQYLEMPKGRRAIFASQEERRRKRNIAFVVGGIVILAVIAFFIWRASSGS